MTTVTKIPLVILNYLPLTLQTINIVKIKRPGGGGGGGGGWRVATNFSVKLQGNPYR